MGGLGSDQQGLEALRQVDLAVRDLGEPFVRERETELLTDWHNQ